MTGDLRLLVTRVNGATKAMLYRAVAAGGQKTPFSSPWRTITFDDVRDVSDHILFATDEKGMYEISVPLSVVGLAPKSGLRLKGDIGILRGDGNRTTARIYWSNKATAITADVPSEAELQPGLWGFLEFK